jgi:hypothetical protein
VRTDRHLTLEPAAGEAPVIDKGLPQCALGFGRIPAQEPRQPSYWSAFARYTAAAVFGEQIAQFLRLLRVEDAPAGRTFAPLNNRVDDPMQRANVLLGRRHSLEDVAQVHTHGAALFLWTKKLDPFQLSLEIGEERIELPLRDRRRSFRHRKRQCAATYILEPLVGNDDDRLRQIE